ncbi:MAG TPA: SRPBCC family protein [Rubrivivax sp.]|nr:SRPBCC family protein [Rubrivivax sp.]
MALQIRESFEVAAPVGAVWTFINDPQNVVACMPGASLERIVDERQFIGAVKLKIGAVSAQYQGTITYTEADREQGVVKMLATGNERGGGTVSGTIVTQLEALGPQATRVNCESSIDLTGKIVQVGRGMIEGVSAQIIKKYVGNVRALLEVPAAPAGAEAAGDSAAGPAQPGEPAATQSASPSAPLAPVRAAPAKEDSINVLAVVFKVIMDRIRAFFRRVFGRA